MKFGKFNIEILDTGLFGLDGGSMFGVVPKVLWSRAYNPGDESNRIPLAARPLLVEWEDRKVLIDTGNGNKMNEKLAKIYNIDLEKSNIDNALEKFNLRPDDITDVILTHLHFDHCGGATSFKNGQIVPTFNNAKYYIQKDHLSWAKKPTEKDRTSFIKENYESLLTDANIEILDGEGELFPGISNILVHGHTKAMQMIKITQNEHTMLYCADLCPTSAHIPVPYVMGYDNFPLTVIEEKKKIMAKAYEEGWILIFEHDAFRQAAVVNMNEKGYFAGDSITISE
jgi:glyoxylase-like metal-dependent hydrolase (beta-lactamase superfamily II)